MIILYDSYTDIRRTETLVDSLSLLCIQNVLIWIILWPQSCQGPLFLTYRIVPWAFKRAVLVTQYFINRAPWLSSGLSRTFLISPEGVNGRLSDYTQDSCVPPSHGPPGLTPAIRNRHQVCSRNNDACVRNSSHITQSSGLRWLSAVISCNTHSIFRDVKMWKKMCLSNWQNMVLMSTTNWMPIVGQTWP